MIDVEAIDLAGLTGIVLPAWPVLLYVAIVAVCLLFRRLEVGLLVTYLFTFYWGFYLHWATVLSSGRGYAFAFGVYVICGILLALLMVASFWKERAPRSTRRDV